MKLENSQSRLPVVIALHERRQHGEHGGAMQKTCRTRIHRPLQLTRRITADGNPAKARLITMTPLSAHFTAAASIRFFYDTVWDVMRLVDYLETRADVDTNRIGLTGISKGGIETCFTAAVDKRIAVAFRSSACKF